jgi:acyl-homoserine lactone acylase PvdQ
MGARGLRRALAVAGLACAVAPAVAGAQTAGGQPITGFRSVLAQGEGQTILADDLVANQAFGTLPASFVNQQPLYVGIMPRAATLTERDLDVYYKRTDFGSMPGGVLSVSRPRPGVQIARDGRFQMAHVTGETRADVMFGAGYATAQERLFMMDAIRRTAKGTLAGLLGPSAAADDSAQLTDQDFSDEELTAQFDSLPERFGLEGARAHDDILHYVAGINARIDEVTANPLLMPAEYAALGARPARWTVADTAAMAVLLVTQFTVSNGNEHVNALMQEAFRERFGKRWRASYNDLRTAEDPEAVTVARRPYRSDRTGRPRRGLNAMPDFDSIKARRPMVSGPDPTAIRRARAAMPDWVSSVAGLKRALPHHASNALLVSPALSATGRPLAAMGPQVSYYSPQIFVEYELHGGGIDAQGVSFPGASPYPLIGHGIDFAWSGTSANGDNQDTFVERLCNPDGSTATVAAKHYEYRGKCIPFLTREQRVTTPLSPLDPTTQPQTIVHRTMRSVHGPVFAYATVAGRPVALTKAKAVNFHELDATIPFMRLAENQPTSARSFMAAMSMFPGTENWFYVDDRNAAFLQSGRYPRHARGSDVDRPFWGDGRADWQGFDPQTYTFKSIPAKNRPRALDPSDGFIISWNNKEAPGWRKGPTEWSNGSVHHALTLERRLKSEVKRQGGKIDLTGLTRVANLAATTDVRGQEDYRWMRRVIGQATGEDERMLGILDDWQRSGSNRLDANGDNAYDHSAAVALMDAWWPRFVEAAFEPALGERLFEIVEDRVLGLGGLGWDWATHVQKDLRAVLGRRVRGRYSRIYCGGPVVQPVRGAKLRAARATCRDVLLTTLRDAVAAARKKHGGDPGQWKVPATCAQTNPPSCDQEVPSTAGAVDTPPFPWQNRGTYHQITEVSGHRGG